MIGWLDAYLLPLLVGLPALGAFFVAVMPPSDRITLRHAGMGASLLTGLVALYATWRLAARGGAEPIVWPSELAPGGVALALDGADLPVLLVIAFLLPMSLRAGAPRIVERTQGYVVLMLVAEALAIAAVLAKSSLLALAFVDATSIPLLLLLGVFGGAIRGTASLRVGMLWFVVDAGALASVTWLASETPAGLLAGVDDLRRVGVALPSTTAALALVPIVAAGFMRLAVAPLSVWLPQFLEEAPVSAAALVPVVVMPVGALALYRHGLLALPSGALLLLGPATALAVVTALLGGLLCLVERDLRRLIAFAGMFHGGLAAVGLFALDKGSVASALVFVSAMGTASAFALFIADALERRYLVRDSSELIGVSQQLPALWRLALLAFVALVGVPLLAGGTLLLDLLSGMSAASSFVAAGLPPNAALWGVAGVGVAWVLLAAGAMGTLKRLSSSPVRQAVRAPSPLTLGQAARLWVPALLVVAAGLLAPLLLSRVEVSVRAELDKSADALAREVPAEHRWTPASSQGAFPRPTPEAP